MKKFNPSFLILITMLVLGSCIKENNAEENIQPGTEPIVFGAEAEYETKADAVTEGYLPENHIFGIYAYKVNTAPALSASYFENLKATVKDTTGESVETENNYYWPTSTAESLKFYAYYPYTNGTDITRAFNADGTLSLTYTVPQDYTTHKDLMAASNTSPTPKSKVSLKFHHKLTRLTFEAKMSSSFTEANVTVTEISIEGVKNSGTVKISDAETAVWETSTTTGNYKATAISKLLNKTSYVSLLGDTPDSFMVMPVGTDFGIAVIKVTLSNGGVLTKKLSEITHSDNNWQMRTWVNYKLELSPDKIEFGTITVQGWDGPKDVPVEF